MIPASIASTFAELEKRRKKQKTAGEQHITNTPRVLSGTLKGRAIVG
jgi:hypothetical protein